MPYETSVCRDGRACGEYMNSASDETPPDDLQSRHVWSDPFPDWQTSGTVNVKAAPCAAKGEGVTDPTKYHMVIETLPDGLTYKTAPLNRLILYQRGMPAIAP